MSAFVCGKDGLYASLGQSGKGRVSKREMEKSSTSRADSKQRVSEQGKKQEGCWDKKKAKQAELAENGTRCQAGRGSCSEQWALRVGGSENPMEGTQLMMLI